MTSDRDREPSFNNQVPIFRTSFLPNYCGYASTMGRFLKPDNIIPNAANPQSWNLYSYVNGNPVMFNDPLGHSCPASIGTSPALYMERSSADWINWGAYGSFMNEVYGGNVAFGGGAGGGEGSSQNGYWQPVYDTTMTTSDTVVWSDELGAWVGGDAVVTATQVGIVWVEYGQANPYLDVNVSLTSHFLAGATMGFQINQRTGAVHPYFGLALAFPPGVGASLTTSRAIDSISEGWNVGVQAQVFIAGQTGYADGDKFEELGVGLPASISVSSYYVFPAIQIEPLPSPEPYPSKYHPINRKFFSPW